jgi:hypothetical protein
MLLYKFSCGSYQEEVRKTINLPVITGQQRKKNEK